MAIQKSLSAVLVAAVVGFSGCGSHSRDVANLADPWASGRLTFRPDSTPDSARIFSAGLLPVFPDSPDVAVLYAPATAARAARVPLILLLHGAGGSGARIIGRLGDLADQSGTIVVAPKSAGITWDVMRGPIGPDVVNIDRVLSAVSRRYRIDPARISVVGFSDGATYALTLGRLNGTLFRSIVAFSPGILIPLDPRGSPPIFISHGTRDDILPIDITSRKFVPELRRQGYKVEYHEFDGPHAVPPEIAALAMRWIAEH